MPPGSHSHRASSLRQSNKRNKRSSASKRSAHRRSGGKVAAVSSGGASSKGGGAGSKSKADRLHMARQRRDAKRRQAVNAKRNLGRSSSGAGVGGGAVVRSQRRQEPEPVPRLVGIISLSEKESQLEETVRSFLVGGADDVHVSSSSSSSLGDSSSGAERVKASSSSDSAAVAAAVTAKFGVHKREGMLTLLTNAASFRPQYDRGGGGDGAAKREDNDRDGEDEEEEGASGANAASVSAALDLCRVCDLVVLCVDGNCHTSTSADGGCAFPTGMSVGGGASAAGSASSSSSKLDLDGMVSARGDRVLSAIKAQGLPTPLVLLVNSEGEGAAEGNSGSDMMSIASHSIKTARRHALKKRAELRRYVNRLAVTEFGDGVRVAELDVPSHAEGEEADSSMMEEDGQHQHQQLLRSKKILPPSYSVTSRSNTSAHHHPTRTALIRTLCTTPASPPKWVADVPRPYLLGTGGTTYDPTTKEVKMMGHVRGCAPWYVNGLVHVPNMGTYAVKSIEAVEGGSVPLSRLGQRKTKNKGKKGVCGGGEDVAMMEASGEEGGGGNGGKKNSSDDSSSGKKKVLLVESDPIEREPLTMFAAPDALDGEQNLVGFDEEHGHGDDYYDDEEEGGKIAAANAYGGGGGFQKGLARPAGWSDYQSAWLDALDDDEKVEGGGGGGGGDGGEDVDHGELAFALNRRGGEPSSGGDGGLADLDMADADDVTPEERAAFLERRRRDQREDLDFPDEVEVTEDERASERFARYRSLKSFRKSYWDPKENLPETYGPLYHFANFRATQRDVVEDAKDVAEAANESDGRWWWGTGGKPSAAAADGDAMDEGNDDDDNDDAEELLEGCVPSGTYVTITIEGVPASSYARISPSSLLSAVSLLPHENKASVIHMGVSQTAGCDATDDAMPVKSKDVLTFRCGWRTWRSRPVFSQNNLNSDKHKFERYLPTGGAFFAASVLGPVTYGPCPVLVFREGGERRRRELVAVGSVLGADADRIVVKRIVLTGYPVRVHKRHATVKYMFYNPDDVKWFKPAGLTTKHGLQGNIEESVGEHGTMKCLFNAPIKQHDTVCLPLYKRIFPKYAPVDVPTEEGATARKDLVVL